MKIDKVFICFKLGVERPGMSILGDMKMYARFAWGLRGFLRRTITLDEARETIRRRLAEREANFLRLVEKGIFGYPRSPYLPLLKMAGCELGDIQNMVRAKGLEETLCSLRAAGVYVSFEEFKGREPMVRNGHVIPVQLRDFDNPYISHCYYAESGGTTGAGTRVGVELDYLADQTNHVMLTRHAHGILDAPTILWRPILPACSGMNNVLRNVRLGNIPQKWFSPVISRDLRPALKYRLATQAFVVLGRLYGVPIPAPRHLPLDQAAVVARWAAKALEAHGSCLIRATISMSMRVCLAAQEEGLSLKGATFMGAGEPPTPAKVKVIHEAGASWLPTYFFSEAGLIGLGCARPLDCNDLHFFKDVLALISYPRKVPGSATSVNAFHFTTLLPKTPKLLLNVESDDFGIIENRPCGCLLETSGFQEHLRRIRSFRKLTGEGVTLVGSEMEHILEEVLPARFGGTPLDYQLLEEEDQKGFTRLSLLVSPRIAISDENAVIGAVLEALGRSSVAADMARAIWSQAGTLKVKRMEPVLTARGKFMPLRRAPGGEGLSA
jgi:hypothetical protein